MCVLVSVHVSERVIVFVSTKSHNHTMYTMTGDFCMRIHYSMIQKDMMSEICNII